MDFIQAPAHPARPLSLPQAPDAYPRCGACAWSRNGTYDRHLAGLGRLRVPRWQGRRSVGEPTRTAGSCCNRRRKTLKSRVRSA